MEDEFKDATQMVICPVCGRVFNADEGDCPFCSHNNHDSADVIIDRQTATELLDDEPIDDDDFDDDNDDDSDIEVDEVDDSDESDDLTDMEIDDEDDDF